MSLLGNSSYASFFSSSADEIVSNVKNILFTAKWTPVTSLARRAVLFTLKGLREGAVRIIEPDGTISQFPQSPPNSTSTQPLCELRVMREAFWVRVGFMGGLGFAEAYMFGDVVCNVEDLRILFKIFLANRSEMDRIDSRLVNAFSAIPNYFTSARFSNVLGISRTNISAHYDISNKMFEGFLSRDMMYSSGMFAELDKDLDQSRLGVHREPVGDPDFDKHHERCSAGRNEDKELHDAQVRKIAHILRRLKVRPGDRILEVGTGWGEFAIRMVQSVDNQDCTVDSITLSSEQKALADARIAAAGLQDRITVHLLDYRSLPKEWAGKFDRFVSIEMIEHVGLEFLATYFGVVHWALKKRDAIGVIQVSTMPESRIEAYKHSVEFIQKWIFPGAFLPSVTQLVNGVHQGSHGNFIIDTIDNMGPHYPQTLREWARRFEGCFADVIVPELKKQYHDVMCGPNGEEEIEIFRRKWLYYFYYCEAGFTTRTLGNHTVSFTREATAQYGCNIEPPDIGH